MKFIVNHLIFVILSIALLFSFTSINNSSNGISRTNNTLRVDSLLTSDFNIQWQQKVNSEVEDLGQLYTENAVKVHTDGTLSNGRIKIAEHYRTNPYQIESISSIKSITAVLDSTMVYEIGRFSTSDKKEFAHLILWREENGKLFRELELIAPLESVNDFKTEVDKKRTDWMEICNAHNTEDLVTKFYAKNALYYNHRPMIIGQEAIIKEYGYMNDPNYELTLNPVVFETINETLAFEIGQCSGSYPGNYVLVWQKSKSGEWRIFFDSNI